jgi:hypothetical protein
LGGNVSEIRQKLIKINFSNGQNNDNIGDLNVMLLSKKLRRGEVKNHQNLPPFESPKAPIHGARN